MSLSHRSLAAWAVCLMACNTSAPGASVDPAKSASAKGQPSKTKAVAKAKDKAATPKASKNHFGSGFKVKTGEPLAKAIARSEKAAPGSPNAAAGSQAGKAPSDKSSCGDGSTVPKQAKNSATAAADEASTCAGLTKSEGEVVRVSGKVDSVCQKAGCWMVLKDGEAKVRIFTKDHGFFLPRDIAGRGAEVEGTLRAKTLSKKFAKHLAEDKGGDPKAVTGPRREYILTASAVALR